MNVIKNSILFIVLNLTFACSNTPQKGQIQKIRHDGKVTDKVNVFIGTGAHCHNFPSAMVPFGAVVAGPDCNTKGWDAAAGYHYDAPTILGFSQQHLSGTGLIELGDLLLVPAIGKIKVNPGTEENPDAGYRNSSSVWAPNRQVHFAMKFSKPFKSHHLYDADKKQFFDTRNDRGCRQLKVIFDFDTQKDEAIMVKIAVSSVSMENALQNLEAEIPGWDFEKVRKEADDKWINEFQRFYAKGSKENIAKFYAALYHTMIHPSILNDVNGQYRGISKMPAEAKGFTKYQMFSLWDTFRALHPLFTIIQQKRTDDIVKSMVDFYKRNPRKMLPMWSMYQDENTCMIGLHALPVIADAYSKGLLSSSPDELLAAMVESSERHGVDNTISRAEYPSYYGQQYYLKKGYHPNDLVRSGVSVTLEHAYDDWTVALAAHQMGNDEVAEKFLKRSQNYRNVWDKETGFFRARLNDGTFREPFDPRAYHREDFNDRDYVEGNAWQYLYFVPHDVYGLMELMGGCKGICRSLGRNV